MLLFIVVQSAIGVTCGPHYNVYSIIMWSIMAPKIVATVGKIVATYIYEHLDPYINNADTNRLG